MEKIGGLLFSFPLHNPAPLTGHQRMADLRRHRRVHRLVNLHTQENK